VTRTVHHRSRRPQARRRPSPQLELEQRSRDLDRAELIDARAATTNITADEVIARSTDWTSTLRGRVPGATSRDESVSWTVSLTRRFTRRACSFSLSGRCRVVTGDVEEVQCEEPSPDFHPGTGLSVSVQLSSEARHHSLPNLSDAGRMWGTSTTCGRVKMSPRLNARNRRLRVEIASQGARTQTLLSR